jgi:hypothetical protein
LHYTNQSNAWFDRAVTKWWLDNVFAPFCFKLFGSQKCILLLDNCPAHEGISDWKTQSNIIVKFLPPNLTSAYQPADQGIISSLKLGYKLTLLHNLLDICDDPVAYAAAKTAGNHMKKGCKGISFGGKPHILDAMNILKRLWEGNKSPSTDAILRCWRKANCLPVTQQAELSNETGHSERYYSKELTGDVQSICDAIQHLELAFEKFDELRKFARGTILDKNEGVQISPQQLKEGIEYWVTVEDDEMVQQSEIEEIIDRQLEKIEMGQLKESATQKNTGAAEEEQIISEQEVVQGPTNEEIDKALHTLMQLSKVGVSDKLKLMIERVNHAVYFERMRRPKAQLSIFQFAN